MQSSAQWPKKVNWRQKIMASKRTHIGTVDMDIWYDVQCINQSLQYINVYITVTVYCPIIWTKCYFESSESFDLFKVSCQKELNWIVLQQHLDILDYKSLHSQEMNSQVTVYPCLFTWNLLYYIQRNAKETIEYLF